MAKWYEFIKRYGKGRFKIKYGKRRFFNSRDMAEAKRTESISNSQAKRGEKELHTGIVDCGCGAEGCFICFHVPWEDSKRNNEYKEMQRRNDEMRAQGRLVIGDYRIGQKDE